MDTTAITINHVSHHFDGLQAINDLSFEVPAGSIFGFLGPNGAGKTTTIHLLLGLLNLGEGEISVLGFDPQKEGKQIRSRAGVLLEHNGLYEQLSAEDNLEFYARIWQLSPQERKERIKELLSAIGLWDRRKDKVGKWSRGMKQKLAIARSVLHRPTLMILDEPTAGLDIEAAKDVRDDLKRLVVQDGVTLFLTSHNLQDVSKLCDHVGIIKAGQMLAIGSIDELQKQCGMPGADLESIYLKVMENGNDK